MRILADVNVPGEYVSALRGDGHSVSYTRRIDALGPTATDAAIVEYAEEHESAVLSTDVTDCADRDAPVPVFVAPQDMTGAEVRAAVARIQSLPFDPARTESLWLSAI